MPRVSFHRDLEGLMVAVLLQCQPGGTALSGFLGSKECMDMDRNPRSLMVVALTMALVVPAVAGAQAIPRTPPPEAGSSGSTAGGVGGATTSSAPDPMRVVEPPREQTPAGSRTPSSSSSSKSGSASSRSGSSTSSGGSSSGSSRVSSGGSTTGSQPSSNGSGALNRPAGSRDRGGEVRTGGAIERPANLYYGNNSNIGLYYPGSPFSPWGRWYPWFYGGYGYVSYDPWRYGSSRYSLWRYGSWYNPYDPYCNGGSYWPCDSYYAGGGGGSSRDDDADASEPSGAVRLRVSPVSAKVYVDGGLVGVVDDFDGLSGHLRLTVGTHLVEIKADGYETFVPEIAISAGKTTTVRGSLKKVIK